ncbi:anaerobic sulfatase maturase [Candidatus Sumerlaeota bacterium]|nr:anaerobic sulfatase maturase [Candidatus Sumerlaeota bacterium]
MSSNIRKAWQVMAKPIGPVCNLDCEYCYYLEKKNLYPDQTDFRMPEAALERFIESYIRSQDIPVVTFVWQGGEPTLLGVDYFRNIIKLQKKYAGGREICNSLQTNGILLNDEWGEFLAENHFLVGISIDGDKKLHDAYRRDRGRQPSFDRVMRGVEILKKHSVEFNTLTVVNRKNSFHGVRVYDFLKNIGSQHIQFIPIVERLPDEAARKWNLELAAPPDLRDKNPEDCPVTSWSVTPRQYGVFLWSVFSEWVKNDVSKVFVYTFEEALASWCGMEPALCVFNKTCGKALVIEHNGDVYSCDHYVYPAYKLGNIMEQPLSKMATSAKQQAFGNDKFDCLPKYCLECEYFFACRGECPRYRFLKTPDGEPGLNYLCEGYKYFFRNVDPYMKKMAALLKEGKSPALIMEKGN